jgi:drug/metabolite transporter superfamily protein YnfA
MTFTNQLVRSDREQGPAPPMSPAEREQDEYKRAQRERVATAVEVGGLCQDLTAYVNVVAHCRLQRDKSDAASQTSGPLFAPDLLVQLTPESQLRRTYQKLLKLEPMLLTEPPKPGGTKADDAKHGGAKPNGTNPPQAGGRANYGIAGTASPLRKSSETKPGETTPPRTTGPKPRETVTTTKPSRKSEIDQKIGVLLARGPRDGSDAQEHKNPLDLKDLENAICRWNELVVELIIDYPAVLAGFRVGKALSFTRWQIQSVDEHWNQVDGNSSADPSADAWDKAFSKQRIDEIQRHVNTLSTVLDSRAVTAVSTGLGYWRNALLHLTSLEDSSSVHWWSWRNVLRRLASIGESSTSRSAQLSSSQTIRLSPGQREQLMVTLEDQVNNWFDVLTERRPPESFPVAGIVASLTKKVVANLWARLFRFLVPTVIVLVILLGLLAAASVMFDTFINVFDMGFWVALKDNLTALLGSLGTALAAVFTLLLAPRGQSMFGRGASATYGALGGVNGGTRSVGVSRGSYYGTTGALLGAAASLKQDVFSNVVEQLRLEDVNLAINDPLVRCVLSLEGKRTGDPQKDAERFLQLVYKDQSNLRRLRDLFKKLSVH